MVVICYDSSEVVLDSGAVGFALLREPGLRESWQHVEDGIPEEEVGNECHETVPAEPGAKCGTHLFLASLFAGSMSLKSLNEKSDDGEVSYEATNPAWPSPSVHVCEGDVSVVEEGEWPHDGLKSEGGRHANSGPLPCLCVPLVRSILLKLWLLPKPPRKEWCDCLQQGDNPDHDMAGNVVAVRSDHPSAGLSGSVAWDVSARRIINREVLLFC